jgi:hypothetical protein
MAEPFRGKLQVLGSCSLERGEVKVKAPQLFGTPGCAREILEIKELGCSQLREKLIKGLLTCSQSIEFQSFPMLKLPCLARPLSV